MSIVCMMCNMASITGASETEHPMSNRLGAKALTTLRKMPRHPRADEAERYLEATEIEEAPGMRWDSSGRTITDMHAFLQFMDRNPIN